LGDWMQDRGKAKENTRDTTHIILSMPNSVGKEDVRKGARAFAKKQFGQNHQYVFALHDDTDNPHVHLVVKNLGFDNKRLHVKKSDPQKWRETFAGELNKLGVSAAATRRSVRGVVKKGTKQAVHQIRADSKREAKTDIAKKKEVLAEYSKADKKPKPWEEKIVKRQTYVRKEWLKAAQGLSKSSDVEDKLLARDILTFVKDMPPMKTERHEMIDNINALRQQQQQSQNQNESTPER